MRLPPAKTGEDAGEAALGKLKRELPFSSRHRDLQLGQSHVNMYTKEDGDAMYQPTYKLAQKHRCESAEGGKEVRNAAITNVVVWPCLASAPDADFPSKWSLNFQVRVQ